MSPIGLISLRRGEALFDQGDDNADAYIVASGSLDLIRTEGGKPFMIDTRGRGAILGGTAVLTDHPRYFRAVASTDTVIFRIPSRHITEEYGTISPLLRACVDTAIAFKSQLSNCQNGIQIAPRETHTKVENADVLIERFKFEIDLLGSIADGDFSMVYQPIVTMQTGKIAGFEALMRWDHPERGVVPPDQFITMAEDLGVIGALTTFAIQETCKTLTQIDKTLCCDDDLFASINISGHDIARPGFSAELGKIIDDYGIPPHRIKLEVTETAYIPDNEDVLDNVHGFQALGCGLSIDDFGTGYSNLAHLKTIPLSSLKIDRAFAGDAHCNQVSGSIVAMLVGLGAALNMDVVAEGVETDMDAQALCDLGCSLAQGYYFHRPTDKHHLFDLLNACANDSAITSVA